ncbi:PstS family phosphate ABC transporter substrate-binding protein [Haloferula sp. BvORR071]|uniref:PstS family phosphate ABC transporter substrate-binding protein n=1 Tax=Haloferula sp. BvORR071 TaxID=1396141 RepID=UPI0005597E82|nr:PstS family phosphate ABC transporter substrate-binding protein [Haloferula sp. BvORR071]
MKLAAQILAGVAMIGLAGAEVIRIKGSDTLGAKLMPRLNESYRAKHPGIDFELSAEGSAVAFPALVNGTADLGMSSRKATPAELAAAQAKGIKLVETVACHDMIVVVVNKANKLKALKKTEVAKVFTGAVKDWSELSGAPGAISIYTRNSASGTYKDWQAMAMNGKDYAPSAQKMAGTEQVVQEVGANKNGIGYVGLASVMKDANVRGVVIDDIEPIAANAKKYAYSRVCYYYSREDASAAVKEFLAFATGEEGKKLAEQTGFVPD